MSRTNRALLLIGSPKGGRSTSRVLGDYLFAGLARAGWRTETVPLPTVAGSREDFEPVLPLLDAADLLVLSFPLYADSLPAITTRTLEWLADHRRQHPQARAQKFAVIVNSGFPEVGQNDTALAICRSFAREAGLEWSGGLAMGAGGALSGRSLDALGMMMRRVRQALEEAAAALAAGQAVPEKAVALMGRPFMPARVYLSMGTVGFKRQAKKRGVLDRLGDRPYAE